MRVGSLFSGIGGLDLGLERAGMEIKWQVENDDFCRRVLAKHWPNVPCYGDIRSVQGNELEPVDLICGGFPCQPVSVAGLRRAQEDERWLWPEFVRLIREIRPRFALMENVPGLYGHGLDLVLADLAALGFDAEWTTLPAAAFGAPHLRERLFIIAYPVGFRRGGSSIFDGGDDLPYYQPWDAAQGVRGWEGWVSWLNEVSQVGVAPNANCEGWQDTKGSEGPSEQNRRQIVVSDDARSRLLGGVPKPVLPSLDDGIPNALAWNKGFGNAIVPQVPEYIGKQLIAALAVRP